MKTLSQLLTDLASAAHDRATTDATMATDNGAEAIRLLEWHVARARSAIHNHVARACDSANREGYEAGKTEAAATYEAAIIANAPAQPTAASFRAQRNAIMDARILGEGRQHPYL